MMLGIAAVTVGWVLSGSAAAPLATVQCGISIDRGRVTGASYFGEMEGFAKVARTTGGLGRPFLLVSSTADDGSRGTLRWAVDEASRLGGGWIGFDPKLTGQTLATYRPIRLSRNVTLDGGCTGIKIVGHGRGSTIYVRAVDNVVVTRLQLEMTPRPKESGDCISVSHGADRVWIANNRIRQCGDGLVDVARAGGKPMRVTISGNRFSDHDAAILINDGNNPADCRSMPGTMVTMFRNLFVNTGQRHPRVAGNALVHVAQSAVDYVPQFDGGTRGGSYGIFVSNGGRVLAEDMYFAPRQRRLQTVMVDQHETGPCGAATVEVRRSMRADGAPPQSVGLAREMRLPYKLPALPVPVPDLPTWLGRTNP